MDNEMLMREITHVSGILEGASLEPITRVTIDTFKARFIPLLVNCGENFNIPKWIEEVGHLNVTLHVLSNEGQLLYVIPPLVAQADTYNTSQDRIYDHLPELMALKADSPAYASRRIKATLMNICGDETIPIEKTLAFFLTLHQIFVDFKMPVPEHIQKTYDAYKAALDDIAPNVTTQDSTGVFDVIDELP